MEKKHTCEAVVIHCIDFRFREILHAFLSSKFPQGYDLISIAGGVKELVEKEEKSFLFQQIQTSQKLHQPKFIVLIQHEDCGAYGGSKAFRNEEKEVAFQADQLGKGERILKASFPDCVIEKYIVFSSGTNLKL